MGMRIQADEHSKRTAISVLRDAGARFEPVGKGSNTEAAVQEHKRHQRVISSYLSKVRSLELTIPGVRARLSSPSPLRLSSLPRVSEPALP